MNSAEKQQSAPVHDDALVAEDWLYAGLHELAKSSFPKRCSSCGRIYQDVDEYVAMTRRVGGRSGFKQSIDDDGKVIVELFRNCECGSTLMDTFADRRDNTAVGQLHRERFSALVDQLVGRGLTRATAHGELLKLLHGQPSTILQAGLNAAPGGES